MYCSTTLQETSRAIQGCNTFANSNTPFLVARNDQDPLIKDNNVSSISFAGDVVALR